MRLRMWSGLERDLRLSAHLHKEESVNLEGHALAMARWRPSFHGVGASLDRGTGWTNEARRRCIFLVPFSSTALATYYDADSG